MNERKGKRFLYEYSALIILLLAIIVMVEFAVITVLKQNNDETISVVSPNEAVTEPALVQTIDYTYYDEFVDYLLENSEAYNNSSEDYMKNQYGIWYTNRGYSDIIIGLDGNLESTVDSVSVFDAMSVYEEMPEGVYSWYGNGFSMIATVEYINKEKNGGIISLSGYSSSGEQINNVTETFYKTSKFNENGGYYAAGEHIQFKFNKEMQHLEIIDVATDNLSFTGTYNFIYPYIYE